jgi:cation transport ATPase
MQLRIGSMKKEISESDGRVEVNHGAAYRSVFVVKRMDCQAEEQLVRMAIERATPEAKMNFRISERRVEVLHRSELSTLLAALKSLGLGEQLESNERIDESHFEALAQRPQSDGHDTSALKWLLVINSVMFCFELAVGIWAESTGLIADSLDMFADAAVYGIALFAVGKSQSHKLTAAHISGWLQLALAVGILFEVVRRIFVGSEPISSLMMAAGVIALIANVVCLVIITRRESNEPHMKASAIFSANDVIANVGVILAGSLVMFTGSEYPDLVIGTLIGVVVLLGAKKILQLK